MRLVIVRHGQTEENAKHIIQGHLPGHLSQQGIQQSKALAEELRSEEFDRIWSSDLQRCIDTAGYLCKLHPNLKLQTTPELREINYGDFQGHFYEDLDWGSLAGPFLQQRFPGGETRQEMAERVLAFVNQLLNDFPEQKILIVTHGGPVRVIMAAAAGDDLEKVLDKDSANAKAIYLEIAKPLKLYTQS